MKNFVLMILMVTTAAISWHIRPTHFLSDQRSATDVELIIPRKFGDWVELDQAGRQIVNPQAAELLNKLYSQTLSRSYINRSGAVVMLSIAYGKNQSDTLTMHYPEVCYPAQGFEMKSNTKGLLVTPLGDIPIRRLTTQLGGRHEPITYWSTLGNHVVYAGLETKIAQIEYGMKGLIPDGLLFRVSTITMDSNAGFEIQSKFISDLLANIEPAQRPFIAGL